MKADDPRMGLWKDEELLVTAYPYDAKVTVIKRLRDGFDPECNQYFADVEFMRLIA